MPKLVHRGTGKLPTGRSGWLGSGARPVAENALKEEQSCMMEAEPGQPMPVPFELGVPFFAQKIVRRAVGIRPGPARGRRHPGGREDGPMAVPAEHPEPGTPTQPGAPGPQDPRGPAAQPPSPAARRSCGVEVAGNAPGPGGRMLPGNGPLLGIPEDPHPCGDLRPCQGR
jgi:hypothetical protein